MELQWLSSLSQKHLVPVSVRMLNISLWTWCRIAAMWSKKDRISMQTLVLHGVRKQPSACQQAQWLQCFQWKRSTFMRSSHSLLWVVGNDYGRPCLFCSVLSLLHQRKCATRWARHAAVGWENRILEDGLHFVSIKLMKQWNFSWCQENCFQLSMGKTTVVDFGRQQQKPLDPVSTNRGCIW